MKAYNAFCCAGQCLALLYALFGCHAAARADIAPPAGVARFAVPPGTDAEMVVPVEPFDADVSAVLGGQLMPGASVDEADFVAVHEETGGSQQVFWALEHEDFPLGLIVSENTEGQLVAAPFDVCAGMALTLFRNHASALTNFYFAGVAPSGEFSTNVYPAISDISLDYASKNAQVVITPDGTAPFAILCRDFQIYSNFACNAAWRLAAEFDNQDGTPVIWTDYDLWKSDSTAARYYLVGAIDDDADEDGLPDLYETFVYGTSTNEFDLDPEHRRQGLTVVGRITDSSASTLATALAFPPVFVTNVTACPDFPPASGAWNIFDSRFVDYFAATFSGWLYVETGGSHTFYLRSDDGSALILDGETVIDFDGLHGFSATRSRTVSLQRGWHEFRLDFFEKDGNAGLKLEWTPPGGVKGAIPDEMLWHLPSSENMPPVLFMAPIPGLFAPGNRVELRAKAWDLDSDGFVAKVEFFDGTNSIGNLTEEPYTMTWANIPPGLRTITAVATDNLGATASESVKLEVADAPALGFSHGVIADYYCFTSRLASIPAYAAREADISRLENSIKFSNAEVLGLPYGITNDFLAVYNGFFVVKQPGLVRLRVTSDDGARLFVDGIALIDASRPQQLTSHDAEIPLAAGFHSFTLEYFQAAGLAALELSWKLADADKFETIPPVALFSALGEEVEADSDSDGITDWWERNFGLDPGNPEDALEDRDADGMSNLAEFMIGSNPLLADTDADGMMDAWEAEWNLNPIRNDAREDPDGDKLCNLMEFKAGTNPFAVDTDADGMSDSAEVLSAGSNPLEADISPESVTVGEPVKGADAEVDALNWNKRGGALYALSRSGSATYSLVVPSPTPDALAVSVAQNNALADSDDFSISLYVDGLFVSGGVSACATNAAEVLFFLPEISCGRHSFRLKWSDSATCASLAVIELRFVSFGGVDTDGDGVPDWKAFAAENSVAMADVPVVSYTSPLCVEGVARNLERLSIFTTRATNTTCATLTPTICDGFFAETTLDPDGADVAIVVANGLFSNVSHVAWVPFVIPDSPHGENSPLRVRKGDALRVTGFRGVDVECAECAVFRFSGSQLCALTNWTDSTPVVYSFNDAGDYLLVASAITNGTPVVESASVSAVSSSFPIYDPAVVIGKTRVWTCPGLDASLTLEYDPELSIRAAETSHGGMELEIKAEGDGTFGIVSRLGDDGPICDVAQVRSIHGANSFAYTMLETFQDGSQLLEMTLNLNRAPENLTVLVEIFVAGVTFENGSRKLILNSEDFDQNGSCVYRLVRAAGVKTSICHRVYLLQNNIVVDSL